MPTSSTTPPRADPSPLEVASADLFDYALIRDYALLLLSSPRRRKRLFAAVFVIVMVSSLGLLLALPKTYSAESRILVQRANPFRYLPGDDAPLRSVSELVLSQTNLESLVRQTNLAEVFERTRAPAARAKDYLLARVFRVKATEEDKRDAMIGTLEKKLKVSLSGEGTLTLTVSWQDPLTAYHLALAAQENFVSGKEVSEITAISVTMGILEKHATDVRQQIDLQLERLRDLTSKNTREARPAARATNRSGRPQRAAAAELAKAFNPPADPRLDTLQAVLAAKRAAIREQEQARSRRSDDIQGELQRLRAVYTDSHPLVIDARQRLEAARTEPLQLRELKADADALEKEIAGAGGKPEPETASTTGVGARSARPMSLPKEVAAGVSSGNAEIDSEASQLRLLVTKYNALLDRIEGARIDQETTQAAFKQRYTILKPPQVPTKPDNLKPPQVVAAGLALGFVLALFACAAVELASGRIERRWQLERQLGVPVLAQLDGP